MKRFGISAALGMILGACAYMDEADGAGGDLPGGDVTAPAAKPATQLDVPAAAPPPAADKPPAGDELEKAGFAQADNDPGLNYAMGFLAKNGFNANDPAVDAAFGGDFSLLKAELAQKGIAGWEQALGLAEQSYERHVKANEAQAEKVGGIVTAIAQEAGVEWEAAVAHVGKSVSPDERTAINGLLANPATAHIAAQFITNSYIATGDVDVPPSARATTDGASAHQGAQGGSLTRIEFTAEMDKLRKTLGDDYVNSPQAQALYRRRQ